MRQILRMVTIDDLLCSAADLGVGCMMGEFFVGILAYADDIVLLAPTANAMRVMLAMTALQRIVTLFLMLTKLSVCILRAGCALD